MYCNINFKTKKALKEFVASGQKVGVHQPGLGEARGEGKCAVEGAWYPKPHTWYATVTLTDGFITKVE